MRVHQWVKNLFVFLPIFFAAKILDVDLLGKSIIGFIAFSLVASSVYILNDYMDIEADRLHPEKKKRPLASGALSKNTAIILLFFFALHFSRNDNGDGQLEGIFFVVCLFFYEYRLFDGLETYTTARCNDNCLWFSAASFGRRLYNRFTRI